MKPSIYGLKRFAVALVVMGLVAGACQSPAGTYGDADVSSADRPAAGQCDGIPDTDGNLRPSYSHAHCGSHRILAPHVHTHARTNAHAHARTDSNPNT